MVDTQHEVGAVPAEADTANARPANAFIKLGYMEIRECWNKRLALQPWRKPTVCCIVRLPHYQGLPQASARAVQGGSGCFADRLFCSTLGHHIPFQLPLQAQNYSFPCRVAMELVTMAAKGLANIYLHNCPVDSWKIIFLALQLETRAVAAPQQAEGVYSCQSGAVRVPGAEKHSPASHGRDPGTLGCLAGLRAALGLGIFPGRPQDPPSSLIWGFLAPMAAASQIALLPPHSPDCSQASQNHGIIKVGKDL